MGVRAFDLLELLEDGFQSIGRNAAARVGHRENQTITVFDQADIYCTRLGIFGGIAQQVDEDLPYSALVGVNFVEVRRYLIIQLYVWLHKGGDFGTAVGDQILDTKGFWVDVHSPGFDLGEIQQVVDEAEKVIGVLGDACEVANLAFV